MPPTKEPYMFYGREDRTAPLPDKDAAVMDAIGQPHAALALMAVDNQTGAQFYMMVSGKFYDAQGVQLDGDHPLIQSMAGSLKKLLKRKMN